MLTLEEKHKMQSKEIHSILWLNYSTWSSSPTLCWKALKSTSPNKYVSFCLTLGMWNDGHWNYNTKKKKTQRRANLILVDWKVHQMLAIKIICHNLQNYWNHHIFFWESIGLEHWEDKIWGSVWIRIPPLKNNPAMNMKWRNICVYIYIRHVLGNQTSWYSDFCFQHCWDFARRAKDVLTKPPEKNKAPYTQFLKVSNQSNLHLAKQQKSNPWLKRAKS